MHINSKSN